MWQGVGHVNPAGGGDRNQFGVDFANQGRTWANVCNMDSDGDGMTNGQELGDPQCIWTPGATPTRTDDLTHPGYCDASARQTCDGLVTAPCTSSTFNCPATNEKAMAAVCKQLSLDQCYTPVIATPQECDMSAPACEEVTGGWAVGVAGECFYKETGFRIGKTGYKRVLLEFHWNNPQHLSGQMDESGFSIYYTPNLRPYDAGVFWTGETHLVIPPGRSRTVVESTCPSRCTKKILKDTIYLVSGFNHMHYKGIAQTVELFSGDTRRYLTNDQSYSYDSPTDVLYDPPVAVHPGDSLKTTCVFRSESSKTTAFYGDATSDEMCFGVFTYYPKNASSNSECYSWKTLNYCDKESGVIMGCIIDDFFNNSHPNTKMVMDKVLENCSPYGGCRQECPAAIAEAEKHPCLAKGVMQDYMLSHRSRIYPDLKTTKFVAAFGSCSCRKDDNNNNNGGFPPHTGGTPSPDVLRSTVVLAFCAVLLL